jgi:hypothetical protein
MKDFKDAFYRKMQIFDENTLRILRILNILIQKFAYKK